MSQFDLSLPGDFSGRVRLFPVSGLVLFPGILQGLHVFESRYRAMTADAIAGDGLISMAVPHGDARSAALPTLFPVVCIGRIVSHTLLETGGFNLLLLGLRRARILRELAEPAIPWRSAEVRLLTDRTTRNRDLLERSRRSLLQEYQSLASVTGRDVSPFSAVDTGQIPLGILCDTLAYVAGLAAESLLRVLAEPDVVRRAAIVTRMLGEMAKSPRQSPTPSPLGFPPQFSRN